MVRLRVNPRLARVSVRREGDWFTVTVSELVDGSRSVRASHRTPRSAILRALYAAEKAGLRGLDLGMGCAYWRRGDHLE